MSFIKKKLTFLWWVEGKGSDGKRIGEKAQ